MTTFVLVHGAFGSPAEPAPVIPELEALGHRAIAVDLPCTDPAAMLDDYVHTVVGAMAAIEGPVVVVGHSAGGATISLVPEHAHVDRLVYVTVFVPEPGRSVVELAGADVRELILSVSRDDGNGCRSFDLELLASIVPPEERVAYLAFLEATQRPQGWAAMEQPWPGRSLPDVPAPTSCAGRTRSCRPRPSARWRRALVSSPSSSRPTTRSSRFVRASSHHCSPRRRILPSARAELLMDGWMGAPGIEPGTSRV